MHLWYVFVLMDIHHIVDDSPNPPCFPPFRSLQETRKHHALDALFADWCLSGKGKTSCLVGGFWLGRNFWWAGGPWVLEMGHFCFGVCFFFRCLPLLANCMILLRQILFKQDTILVNQHSCSCKIHLGRTYQSTSQALWKGPLGVPRILEEFDWWKWASYCNQKPLLLGEVAWGQRVEKFNFHRR